jgi:hypothetical protein
MEREKTRWVHLERLRGLWEVLQAVGVDDARELQVGLSEEWSGRRSGHFLPAQ